MGHDEMCVSAAAKDTWGWATVLHISLLNLEMCEKTS